MNKAQNFLQVTEMFRNRRTGRSVNDDPEQTDSDDFGAKRKTRIPFPRIIMSMQRILNKFANQTSISDASSEGDYEIYDPPSRGELESLAHTLNNLPEMKRLDVYFETSDVRGKYTEGLLQVGQSPTGGLVFILNERATVENWVDAYDDNWKLLLRSVRHELETEFSDADVPAGSFRPSKQSRAASARHRRERQEREGFRKSGHPRGSIFQSVGRHPSIAKWRSHRKRGLFDGD